MNLHLTIGPIIALIAGILILVMPRLLNYVVALYLIIIGVLGLVGDGPGRRAEAPETAPAAIHSITPVGHTTGI